MPRGLGLGGAAAAAVAPSDLGEATRRLRVTDAGAADRVDPWKGRGPGGVRRSSVPAAVAGRGQRCDPWGAEIGVCQRADGAIAHPRVGDLIDAGNRRCTVLGGDQVGVTVAVSLDQDDVAGERRRPVLPGGSLAHRCFLSVALAGFAGYPGRVKIALCA